MRRLNGKRVLLCTFLAGLFGGVLYANLIADSYLTANGIFSSFYLAQFSSIFVDKTEFLFYLLKIRVIPAGILLLAGGLGIRKLASVLYFLWYGFLAGILLVTSIIQLGVQGIIVSLFALFPQMIFYILAYAVMVWALYAWPQVKWSPSKTVFVVLMLSVGILTEVYVNPVLLKWYLSVV